MKDIIFYEVKSVEYKIYFQYKQDLNIVSIGPVFSSDIPEAIMGQLRRDNRIPEKIEIRPANGTN